MNVKEVNYEDVKDDWGHALFLELTKNETQSLLVRNAFDPNAIAASRLSDLNPAIHYTQEPHSFKVGANLAATTVAGFLEMIQATDDFYSSWGVSCMNDKAQHMEALDRCARNFVDDCLDARWRNLLCEHNHRADSNFVGHYIAGNAKDFSIRTNNHYVLSINHVFQIWGEKTWLISDILDAAEHPAFTQLSAMEFAIDIDAEEYRKLDYVSEFVSRPGDYFYNAPLVGHAVGMDSGPNLMLSIRHGTTDYRLPERQLPFLYRALNVTRDLIHGDVNTYTGLMRRFQYHDSLLYGDGTACEPTSPAPPTLSEKILWRLKRMARRAG